MSRRRARIIVHGVAWLPLLAASMFLPACGSRSAGPAEAPRPPERVAGPEPTDVRFFTDVTAESGLQFQHVAGKPGSYFFPQIMSSGAAFLDFDCDGRLDIYLINGHAAEGPEPDSGATNRLFRQREDGRFEDVTSGSGLADAHYGTGVAVGDVNNDGWPDVYVCNYGPDRLYLNSRDGTFRDGTGEAGIENIRWAASATFVDVNRDGWLDLFVTNYVDYHPSVKCSSVNDRPEYCSPSAFDGTSDKLFINRTALASNGQVRFEDCSAKSGIADRRGPGLGVAPGDFNGDGWPDIYVANDGAENYLWINNRDETFSNQGVIQGAAYDARGRPQAGMGVATGDLNDDGRPDLFVTHLAGESNALYTSGANGFEESAVQWGLTVPSLPMTGFGTALFDLELDGDLDLAVANGRVTRPKFAPAADPSPATAEFWRIYAEPNQLYLGDGQKPFAVLNSRTDPFTGAVEVSRALSIGDIDNDGDLDMLVSNTAGPARLYRNDAERRGRWLAIRAIEPAAGGRDAYGARVRVFAGERTWTRWIWPGTSYLSSHDPRVHFGLGPVDAIDRIEVAWPDGTNETFSGAALGVDAVHVLERGRGAAP